MAPWFNSLRIRLTVLFGGLSLLSTLGAALYINQVASARMTESGGQVLHRITLAIATALGSNLTEREREIILLSQSSLLSRGDLRDVEVRHALDRRKRAYQQYAWLGVASPDGTVLTASDGLLEGVNVGQRPWFQQARRGAYLGDVHEAVLLAKKLQASRPGEPLRFVDFAAPVLDPEGRLRGVLGSHAHWAWVAEVIRRALPVHAAQDGIQVFVVGKDGSIHYPFDAVGHLKPPSKWLTGEGHGVGSWDGQRYLISRARVTSDTATDLGWHIIVRQPVTQALAPVRELHRTLLLLGAAITVLFMVLAYRFAVRISRPVERLALTARRIESGDKGTGFPEPGGVREIHQLTVSLRGMTQTLIAHEQELEQKVRERTAELSAANQELERLARRDALTGLNNRLSANECLRKEFQRMKRTGTGYAVLLMDIDHFKRVNDTHGHETGDQVLRQVAEVLQSSARVTDFVARFGGEEFLAVLPDTDAEGAAVVAEKIRAAMAGAQVPVVGQVTLSLGLALATPQDVAPEAAVGRADAALYRAKAEGRNRVAR